MMTAVFLPCNSMWLRSSGRLLLALLLLIFFLLSPRVACAEDLVGTAYDNLYGDSLTSRREYAQMLEDLASRWWESEGNVEGKTCPIVDINGNPIGSNFQDRLQFRTTMLTLGSGQYCIVDRETGEPIRMGSPAIRTVYDDWYEYFTGESADLGGGESGGGGGGVVGTVSSTMDFGLGVGSFRSRSGVVNSAASTTFRVNLSGSNLTKLQGYSNTYSYGVMIPYILGYDSYNQNTATFYYVFSNSEINVSFAQQGTFKINGVDQPYYKVTFSATGDKRLYGTKSSDGPGTSLGVSNGIYTMTPTIYDVYNLGTSYTPSDIFTAYWNVGEVGGGGSESPTEPIRPPQIDLPTPVAPTVNVSPDVSFSPTVNVSPTSNGTSTTTADLTPILEAIRILNDNLIAYGDALESDINGGFVFLSDFLGDWFDFFSDQMDGISTLFDEWMRYLDVDLQAVITWLQAIYETMGDDINNVIADPVVQPDSWWDRLASLLDGLLGDLPTALGDMTAAFAGVRTLFPFSIPWDLGVLLGLFVAQPVTPVVNVPFPYSVNGVAYVRVDCTPYDGVMAAVRSVELVMFAAGLAFKTRDMLRNVEV